MTPTQHTRASPRSFFLAADLREPPDEATTRVLREGLLEHQVLFFRDQPLEHAHHRAFAARFGEAVRHPAYDSPPGFDEIATLVSTPEAPTRIDTWHSDMTFLERPPLGSILRARVVPEAGGDTLGRASSGRGRR